MGMSTARIHRERGSGECGLNAIDQVDELTGARIT
jgi:hypothetical protein